jgi:hypothetical protein
MDSPEHERRAVVEYFAGQSSPDTKVEHAEKIASERIYGRPHDVWDLHASDGRWWIITNPTNLYSQDEFRSMDYALSFHIGVTTRVIAHQAREARTHSAAEEERLAHVWRGYEQAGDALDNADEAEEFQAVGMRCREALLVFIKDLADDSLVPTGKEIPKRADFVNWSALIADHLARGRRMARLRSYLKLSAQATWELVNWLTHTANATRFDAEAAHDATGHLLGLFGMALVRMERGQPDRCPRCTSYRLVSDFRHENGENGVYVTLCAACGWESPQPDEPHAVSHS